MNERPHVDYFDGLRIFAALCVIFMHTAAGPLRAGINTGWHLLNVCTSLAFTAVPLFFMMSGYLLMTSRKTADISVLLRHRLPRLVVPLAGWTVVAVLWQMFLAHTLTPGAIWAQLVTALHGPVMVHFWYLYTLIALYALSPILYGGIQVLGKSGRVYLFVLAAAVSAHTILMTVLPDGAVQYVDLDIFDKLKIFGGHMATFVLGYLLGSCEKKIPNWLLALGAVVSLAVISVGTWVLTVRTGEFNQNFQNQSSGFEIVLAACIFLLCKQTCNRPPRAWVKAVTEPVVALSMAIYLMHNIFLSMLYSAGVSVRSFGSTVGVPQLQLGGHVPQAARAQHGEKVKTQPAGGSSSGRFLRCTFRRGAASRARPRRRCSPALEICGHLWYPLYSTVLHFLAEFTNCMIDIKENEKSTCLASAFLMV